MGAAVLSGWQLGLVQGESSVALGIYETGSRMVVERFDPVALSDSLN